MKIPKLRKESFFPNVLERRSRTEEALQTVAQEAYAQEISTRKMKKLFKALVRQE